MSQYNPTKLFGMKLKTTKHYKSHLGKKTNELFLANTKVKRCILTLYKPINSISNTPRRWKYLGLPKDIYKNIHHSFSQNRPKLKNLQMSLHPQQNSVIFTYIAINKQTATA